MPTNDGLTRKAFHQFLIINLENGYSHTSIKFFFQNYAQFVPVDADLKYNSLQIKLLEVVNNGSVAQRKLKVDSSKVCNINVIKYIEI